MVNHKLMLYPQEVELHYILPALRRELTDELKAMGFEQKEIARLLKVSEPAISQYVQNKRAQDVKFPKTMRVELKNSAKRLAANGDLLKETQLLLGLSLKERVTCVMHCKLADIEPDCGVCFEHA